MRVRCSNFQHMHVFVSTCDKWLVEFPKTQVSHSGRRNRSSSWQLRLRKSHWWWNKATQIIEQLPHTEFMCCIPANHNHEHLFIGVTLDTNLICIDRVLVVIQNLGSPNQHSVCLTHLNDSIVLGKLSHSCSDCISQRPYIMRLLWNFVRYSPLIHTTIGLFPFWTDCNHTTQFIVH